LIAKPHNCLNAFTPLRLAIARRQTPLIYQLSAISYQRSAISYELKPA
jgi:hypothetical protein